VQGGQSIEIWLGCCCAPLQRSKEKLPGCMAACTANLYACILV
jgi:hypothetical protein